MQHAFRFFCGVVLVSLVGLSQGCFSSYGYSGPPKISQDNVDSIHDGTTTLIEVQHSLGQQGALQNQDQSGDTHYAFRSMQIQNNTPAFLAAFHSETNIDQETLLVTVDSQGIVKSHQFQNTPSKVTSNLFGSQTSSAAN